MIIEPRLGEKDFIDVLGEQYRAVSSSDGPLAALRNKSWKRFLELGLPSRKSEFFQYIKLRNFYNNSYALTTPFEIAREEVDQYIYPECRGAVLLFVNGYFQPELSQLHALPAKVVVKSLSSAANSYGALIANLWGKGTKDENDPFVALNGALHGEGLFLYLPPETQCQHPIQILYVTATQGVELMTHPRIHCFAGAHSDITLLHSHASVGNNSGSAINQVMELTLEDNARISYTQNNCHKSDDCWHFDAVRATLKRNSSLKTISATNGSATVRNDYRIALNGKNSEALLNGMWMLNKKREAHHHIIVDHQSESCRSMQLYKGALANNSHSSFEGKIIVRKEAQQTNAFQLNNNLLLSDGANAASKPNLEIFADDVKASHGATVGQLDSEELFYLRARGFAEIEAKRLLVNSYYKKLIDQIEIPSLRRELIRLAAMGFE